MHDLSDCAVVAAFCLFLVGYCFTPLELLVGDRAIGAVFAVLVASSGLAYGYFSRKWSRRIRKTVGVAACLAFVLMLILQ
jgi:hypothetical protein